MFMLIQPMEFILNKDNENEVFLYITNEMVKGIRPWYLVSNYGNVYSTNSRRLLNLTTSADGYKVCTVRTIDNKGITIYVHRVEMMAFKYESGCEFLDVDHVNCNKLDNYITNLEWVTTSENTRRAAENGLLLCGEDAPWTKVSDIKVHEICSMYVSGYGISEIANTLSCGIDSVFRIVHGIGRTNVSSLYDIESRYRNVFTIEQLHMICNTFSTYRNHKYSDIKRIISYNLGRVITRDEDSIIRNLYRRDPYCFKEISSLYQY